MDITDLQETTYTIAQLAETIGLSAHTLRYYEIEGILFEVPRWPNGRRYYTDFHVRWLTLVQRLRRTGMPIQDIRRYTDLYRAGDDTVMARLQLLQDHQAMIEAQIAALCENLDALKLKIQIYQQMLLQPKEQVP